MQIAGNRRVLRSFFARDGNVIWMKKKYSLESELLLIYLRLNGADLGGAFLIFGKV